jgi:catechol 2,3-dioxygenase-like lactoylglutathione lyase family enzyme
MTCIRPASPFDPATPILRVTNLAASLDYYTQKLGFTIAWQYPSFAQLNRGRATLFLSMGDQGHTGTWAWMGCADADDLYAEYRATGAKIRNPPTNYAWALELQVEDLDGNVLRIGSDSLPNRPHGEWIDMYGDHWINAPDGTPTRVPPNPPQTS